MQDPSLHDFFRPSLLQFDLLWPPCISKLFLRESFKVFIVKPPFPLLEPPFPFLARLRAVSLASCFRTASAHAEGAKPLDILRHPQ